MATLWDTLISLNEDSAANYETCLMCQDKEIMVKSEKRNTYFLVVRKTSLQIH